MNKSFANISSDRMIPRPFPTIFSESQPFVNNFICDTVSIATKHDPFRKVHSPAESHFTPNSTLPFKNWEDTELFCVKWTPPIDGFNQFIKDYRKTIGCPLGGSRTSRHRYADTTIAKVLSVGPFDNRSSLPQRISLSNFKIGTPITSFGGIYRYHPPTDEPEYLLIRRNDSVSYIDLVRGNYRESQLFFMIQDLPLNERQRLLTYANDYDTLWVDLHMKPAEGDVYEFGKEAFIKLAPHLKNLFEKVPSLDPDGKFLWLFPKGRPEWRDSTNLSIVSDDLEGQFSPAAKFNRTLIPESPFECALREFKEETNGIDLLTVQGTQLLFSEPIVERFLGSNSKNYQTNYFVFKNITRPELEQFPMVDTPIRKISTGEVSVIKWVPLSELSQYLRPSRLDLIGFIETHLPQDIPDEVSPIWKCPAEMNDFIMEGTY